MFLIDPYIHHNKENIQHCSDCNSILWKSYTQYFTHTHIEAVGTLVTLCSKCNII